MFWFFFFSAEYLCAWWTEASGLEEGRRCCLIICKSDTCVVYFMSEYHEAATRNLARWPRELGALCRHVERTHDVACHTSFIFQYGQYQCSCPAHKYLCAKLCRSTGQSGWFARIFCAGNGPVCLGSLIIGIKWRPQPGVNRSE
jgi:hypothetical protein